MDEFVASHADAEVMENGKIRCTLTGHEVPPQLQTVQAYWTGKKYRNAKARREYDYSQHEPYLVPHTKSEHLLYCTLTKQPVRARLTAQCVLRLCASLGAAVCYAGSARGPYTLRMRCSIRRSRPLRGDACLVRVWRAWCCGVRPSVLSSQRKRSAARRETPGTRHTRRKRADMQLAHALRAS